MQVRYPVGFKNGSNEFGIADLRELLSICNLLNQKSAYRHVGEAEERTGGAIYYEIAFNGESEFDVPSEEEFFDSMRKEGILEPYNVESIKAAIEAHQNKSFGIS